MFRLFIALWFLLSTSGNAQPHDLVWMRDSHETVQCRPIQSRQTLSDLLLKTDVSLRALFRKSHISSRINHAFVGLFWSGVWDASRASNSFIQASELCVPGVLQ